ncbi:hypothetical protein HQ40_02500 [Porphyromonas gulae]|nr:hypothetical protein HQ40_02500 [Porphyromonas gulae]KGN78346.1 hypothetical protein HR13_08865 [Porphyromonas gulae]KGO02543.1 hypothetical protein HQ42_05890 [Porphyromonas gulae]
MLVFFFVSRLENVVRESFSFGAGIKIFTRQNEKNLAPFLTETRTIDLSKHARKKRSCSEKCKKKQVEGRWARTLIIVPLPKIYVPAICTRLFYEYGTPVGLG